MAKKHQRENENERKWEGEVWERPRESESKRMRCFIWLNDLWSFQGHLHPLGYQSTG